VTQKSKKTYLLHQMHACDANSDMLWCRKNTTEKICLFETPELQEESNTIYT
jgi:hypothetical protein